MSNVTYPPATGSVVARARSRVAGWSGRDRTAALDAPDHVPDAANGRSNRAAKYTVYALGWPQNRPLVTEPLISRSPVTVNVAPAEPFWLPATLTSRRAWSVRGYVSRATPVRAVTARSVRMPPAVTL